MDLVITGPLTREEIPDLCRRALCLLREEGAGTLVCDVGALAACDAVVVDALARLKLLARRQGSEMRVRGVSDQLSELIDLAGLSEVLRVSPS